MEVYIDDVMVKSQDLGIKYGSSFSKYILIFFAPFCFLILTHAQLANDWVSLIINLGIKMNLFNR